MFSKEYKQGLILNLAASKLLNQTNNPQSSDQLSQFIRPMIIVYQKIELGKIPVTFTFHVVK